MKQKSTANNSPITYNWTEVIYAIILGFALLTMMWNGTNNFFMGVFGYCAVIAFYYLDKRINPEQWTKEQSIY